MNRIGLFFGTFDPLHNGHVAISNYFISKLNLDELWLVVTPQNPFKNQDNISDANKRLEIVSHYCDFNEKIKCVDIEFNLPSPNYTADTLDYLVNKNTNVNFFILLGEDNLNSLHLWKNYENILKLQVCVYPRKSMSNLSNSLLEHPNVKLYNAPVMDISSTKIRKKKSKNESINHLVPKEILEILTKP